ncbi:hypothetical protein KJ940_20615, partial [Myxococcota bacterium]|nr:hypothetical protein [Myxococcota bacterium]
RPSAPPAPPPAADTPEAWAAYLRALHIDHRLDQGPGVGRQPRLIFTEAGPRLLIGFFDSPVVFSPEHGAVLTFPTLLEGRPALVLDAQEAPW